MGTKKGKEKFKILESDRQWHIHVQKISKTPPDHNSYIQNCPTAQSVSAVKSLKLNSNLKFYGVDLLHGRI